MWKQIGAGVATAVGVTALWRWIDREKPLYIDLERVNREFKDRIMDDPEEHAYRERVKDRIMRGEACAHPPLFGGGKARIHLLRSENGEAQTA